MTIEIIVGSVLGASEYVAEECQSFLQQQNIESNLHLQPDISEIDLSNNLLIISSTHGAGDLPDNIQEFIDACSELNEIDTKALIIGLGDTSYDTYCQAADTIEKVLTERGVKLLAPSYKIDVLNHPIPEETALEWFKTVYSTLQ